MTAFELLVCLAVIMGLILVAWVLGAVFDASSIVIGGALALVSICFAVALRVYLLKTLYPKCENGTCGSRDYELIGGAKELGISEQGFILECRCGKRYLVTGKGEFLAMGDDQRPTKYKVKRHFYSRWTDASELQ